VIWQFTNRRKKKLLVELEQSAEISRLAIVMASHQMPDFEAWESLVLRAARQGGAGVMGCLLRHWQQNAPRQVILCSHGHRMSSRGLRSKELLTTLGRVPFSRSLYQCAQCHQGRFPADEQLDMVQTTYSAGVRRLMARAGCQSHFEQASEDLLCYAGLRMEPREIERVAEEVGYQVEQWLSKQQDQIMHGSGLPSAGGPSIPKLYVSFDGTGVPMRKSELLGRKGKQPDGSARTREVKLGCVFTQAGLDKEGNPMRDPDSTTYVGAIESSGLFGWRIYAEALRRGLARAKEVIVLTDGARYNRSIAQMHFPYAVHIVDLYHAYEHLTLIAHIYWGKEAKAPQSWKDRLAEGNITRLVSKAGQHLPSSMAARKALSKQLGYFERNAAQMLYADYRQKKYFVGSGVVEAGCRTVIGERLKQSGMHWSVRGANAIIALRCCILSGRFEDFWASRTS
jgi:hypothetical protein